MIRPTYLIGGGYDKQSSYKEWIDNFEGKVKKLLRHKRLVVMEIQLMGQNMEVTLGLGVVSRQGTGMIREIRMETRQVPTGIEEEIVNFR